MSATPSLADIRADFALLDDWEDRYRFLIELGRALPPLDETHRTEANKVRGCASQVWLHTRITDADGKPRLEFSGDSDAHIVKGLIAVLLALYDRHTPDEILAADANALFAELGLAGHLTPQRSNGFAAMVARIRTDAAAVAAAGRQA
jgi:cysteine desulfuration protein SufE